MGKEVAIIHTDLTLRGGGERVCVSLIEALNNQGCIPSLYTFYPPHKADFAKYYSKNVLYTLHKIYPLGIRKFETYKQNLTGFISPCLAEYDIVINTGAFFPFFFKSFLKRLLVYVYCPPLLYQSPLKYQKSLLWYLYYFPQQMMIKKGIACLKSNELLAVSDFTKLRIKYRWGKNSTTIYPPVDLEKFKDLVSQRRSGVISVGRFSPEKNHLTQLRIAQQMPELTFRLCGSATAPHLHRCLSEIKMKSEEMGLKNIEFYPNLSFARLQDLLSGSKYFLHSMVDEDFGLTPCEAISAGCMPLVHNSGGSIEVVPIRELRYNDWQEGVARLKHMDKTDPQDWLANLQNHVQRNFSETGFQKKMIQLIGI